MICNKKVFVGVITYNAHNTLARVVGQIPCEADWIVVSDDCSSDRSVEIARGLGLQILTKAQNEGYGANQKTCYTHMLRHVPDADILVMLHGDHQYDPGRIPDLVRPLAQGTADVAFGVRGGRRRGGMPLYKIVGNRALCAMQNAVFGLDLDDYSTGYKAYSRRALESVDFLRNSNGFLFDEEINAQLVHAGSRIAMVDVDTRYDEDSSSVGVAQSVSYGIGTLLVLGRFWIHNRGWYDTSLLRRPPGCPR